MNGFMIKILSQELVILNFQRKQMMYANLHEIKYPLDHRTHRNIQRTTAA